MDLKDYFMRKIHTLLLSKKNTQTQTANRIVQKRPAYNSDCDAKIIHVKSHNEGPKEKTTALFSKTNNSIVKDSKNQFSGSCT